MTKEMVLDSLEAMPDEFPLEDLLERLVFVQKVEEGLKQPERGETIPIDEVKERLRKWSA
jgi:predicted transcriptional regulator